MIVMNDFKLMLAALAGTVTLVGACGCSHLEPLVNYQPPVVTPPDEPQTGYKVICDFETVDIGFATNDALQYSVVENTDKESGNPSDHYGQVISAGGQWELIYSEVLEPFDFTRDGAVFTMKVKAPKVNGHIYFKLEGNGVEAKEITDVTSLVADQWHTLTYDFTSFGLPDNAYNKIVLLFDAGETGSGETWLFDDIFQTGGSGAEPETPANGRMQMFCDFDNITLQFNVNEADKPMTYEVCDNPSRSGINTSGKVGHVVSGGHEWELIWSEKLDKALMFSDGGVFRMKVLSPKANGKVYFKIEGSQPAQEITDVVVPQAGVWTQLEYDFSSRNLPDGVYNNFVILFDAGETGSGEHWYFDDIEGPAGTLMRRTVQTPVLAAPDDAAPAWRGVHVANAAVLTPDETPDGNWMMYVRGSGNVSTGYHDQIGIFTQEADAFTPAGWQEYPSNPVIHHGDPGTCDELNLLDCAPCVGKDGRIYFYYQAVRGTMEARSGSLAVRASTDEAGYAFSDAIQLKDGVGCSDAVYHDGKYYIFYGYGYGDGQLKVDCAVTEDPLDISSAQVQTVLLPGGGPDNFDSRSVNGTRIFRLEGVDKWFMVYQGSAVHFDFPDRFHVAYSDDLLNWTKVDNDLPFFKRGQAGTWDQGGIWFGEVVEYQDQLYMFYEGWGCVGEVPDRDEEYFAGGNSSTGFATVSKADFLDWCGLE